MERDHAHAHAHEHVLAGPPAESLGAGTVIDGRYRLASAVVRHATDAIYTALDERSRQRVRIRVTLQEPDATLLEIRHPMVPTVLAHGLVNPTVLAPTGPIPGMPGAARTSGRLGRWYYVVTEWFDGAPLSLGESSLLGAASGGLARQRAWATLAMDLLDALEHVHRQAGRAHGNLSLASFWEGRDGRLRIIDLAAPDGALGSEGIPYASPERLRGMPRDERSDVYQVACVLYALAFGIPPFGSDLVEARSGHLLSRLPEAPSPEVLSPSLFAVLRTALEKQPHHRFAGPAGMRAAFAVALSELDRDGEFALLGETVIKTPAELMFPSGTLASAPSREQAPTRWQSRNFAREMYVPAARPGRARWAVALAAMVVFGTATASVVWVAILGALALIATQPTAQAPASPPPLPILDEPKPVAQAPEMPEDPVPGEPLPGVQAPVPTPLTSTVPVDFERNDWRRPVVRSTFAQFVAMVRQHPGLVKLTGHTDDRGPAEVNYRVGLGRAWMTQKLLVLAGIEEPKLPIDSKGETEPIADNSTPEGRAANRRVTAEFLPPGVTVPPSPPLPDDPSASETDAASAGED